MNLKVFQIRLAKEHLLADEQIINDFMAGVAVKKTSVELINGQTDFWSIIVFYDEKMADQQNKQATKTSTIQENELTTEELEIYETLKRWRKDKAFQQNVAAFTVCHNTELISVAKLKPRTLEELSKIKGFGGKKTAKIGDELIAVLNSI